MVNRRIAIYLLYLSFLAGAVRVSAQVKASASFDPARVEAGDTFSLRVLVTGVRVAPKRVSFAAWQKQLPAENILSKSDWTRSGEQWVQRFTLIAFDSVVWQLAPLTVQLHLNDTVQTNELDLTVVSTQAGTELSEMDTIRDIRREPTRWTDYWPWAAGALVLLLLLFRFARRRSKRSKPVAVVTAPPLVKLPAQEIALQKLAELEQHNLWQQGQLVEYYAQISIIVREYLEHQYHILALESTTREIANLLKDTKFPDHLKATLDYLLHQADMVKYAEMPPPPQFHVQALENARKVVKEG